MSKPPVEQRFAEAMGQLLGPEFPDHIALAVSGGGDSMAMLGLAHNWARVWGTTLSVVTVDHGLRVESAAEAEMVAAFCAEIGRPHTTLRWQWNGQGNVQDAARRARLELINGWRGEIDNVLNVLMAHTADDLAENLLIRLARGSGVEGLAAIRAKRMVAPHGLTIVRPCLDIERDELRQYAKTLQIPWIDDPSNEDPKYDRVRARRLLTDLSALGLDKADLVNTAHRMRRASEALQARAVDVANKMIREVDGCLFFSREGFAKVEEDTQLRLLAAGLMWISSSEYRPRAASLEDLLDRLLSGGSGTLSGVMAQSVKDEILLYREERAVEGIQGSPEQLWDSRWQIFGPQDATEVRALGEAIKECPEWRDSGLPRSAVMASPAVFQRDLLISAPVACYNSTWQARIVTSFATYLLSH